MFPFDDVIMSLQAANALIFQIIHLSVNTFCDIFVVIWRFVVFVGRIPLTKGQ